MNWEFGKVTDYFDNSEKNSIWEYSQKYGRIPMGDRPEIDNAIKNRITGYLDQVYSMKTVSMDMIAGCIVDDVYRSGNVSYYYNDDVAEYLGVTLRVVMDWYWEKGIQIHYMTNNSFSDLTRPLVVFPFMLDKSDLLYICPQHIAWIMMQSEGIPMEQFYLYFKDYARAAYSKTYDVILKCLETGMHYLHLDIGAGADAFEEEFMLKDDPGHILIFREDAPQDSAKYYVL